MTPLIEAFKKQHSPTYKKEYRQNKLESLGIESKRQSELNDGDELESLAENIKQSIIKIIKVLMMRRAAVRARERLLPFGMPKATSSTTLMEIRAIKNDKVRAGMHLLKN